MRYISPNIASVVALALSAPLAAQTATSGTEGGNDGVFTLGQITITAPRDHEALDDNVINNEQMWKFNASTLDQAVPGATTRTS